MFVLAIKNESTKTIIPISLGEESQRTSCIRKRPKFPSGMPKVVMGNIYLVMFHRVIYCYELQCIISHLTNRVELLIRCIYFFVNVAVVALIV